MLSNYEKKLLADAMNVAHIAKLPKAEEPGNLTWIEALAKIKLQNGSYGFGIVRRNPDSFLSSTFKYINGDTSAIMCIEEVYPYENIDARRIKKFADKEDVEGRIAYLKSLELPYEIDFDDTSIAHLNEEIVKAALYQQLNQK